MRSSRSNVMRPRDPAPPPSDPRPAAYGEASRSGSRSACTMSVTTLDHVNILTADVARAKEFCVTVLGLEEGPRPPFSSPGFWLYAGGTAVVHISFSGHKELTHAADASRGNAAHVVVPGSVDHVAFRCS